MGGADCKTIASCSIRNKEVFMRVSGVAVDVTIDEEFAAMIKPLEAEERQQLEENIIEYGGARDPLVVWVEPAPKYCSHCSAVFSASDPDGIAHCRHCDHHYSAGGTCSNCYKKMPKRPDIVSCEPQLILLDGHNRYEICTRLELPFDVHELRFKAREEAADWIDKNQLGRRNLDSRQMSLLRGRRYNRTKPKQGGTGANQHQQTGQNVRSALSASELAAEHGVNEKTIRRDGEFAEAVEALGIGKEIVSGKIDAPKHEIVAAAKALPETPTQEQVAEAVEAVKTRPHVANNSGDNEWYTPDEYLDAARSVVGKFDLDPASNPLANDKVRAATFYTADDDGLQKDWAGVVWMNPPYESGLIGKFAEKLCDSFASGDVHAAVVLVNNATETRWFQAIAGQASAVCFPKGRVKFWHPRKEAVPLQGQAVLYLGSDARAFVEEFSAFGFCMEVSR
jgi:phage N-6-adenine-methyltransferase